MDKIYSLGEASSYKSLKKKKPNKAKGSQVRIFSSLIESTENNNGIYDLKENNIEIKEINDFLSEIIEFGDDLKALPNIENIKRYKQAIKYFLKYVIRHMLGTEEKVSGKNILKRKKYKLIKIIDRKLECLTLDFIKSQREEIDILSRVDEINGLLVDILK